MFVIGAKRYKHEEHLLVEAPDGTKAYIPAWMTHRAWATSELVSLPRIELAALENLRRLVDNLVSSPHCYRPDHRQGERGMALNSHQQADLFRDAGLAKTQITESEQQRVKELMAELMLLVIDAEAFRMNQEEMDDE